MVSATVFHPVPKTKLQSCTRGWDGKLGAFLSSVLDGDEWSPSCPR